MSAALDHATRAAAAAIANERGGRRGAPPIVNVLDVLPAKLREEVLEDAHAALEAAGFPELLASMVEWFGDESAGIFPDRDTTHAAVDRARAAICKARGRH